MSSQSTIALISVHSDPASETGNQNVYVRQLGEALSRLGWQVDMFTRKTDVSQDDLVQHNPLCRTIRLTSGATQLIHEQNLIGYLPKFLERLLQFQRDNKIKYNLVHTNYWLSAWVGIELKKYQPLKHIHTYHTLGAVKYADVNHLDNLAKNRLAIEKTCLETADASIATCPQQRDYLKELVSDRGNVEIIPFGTDTSLFGSLAHISAKQEIGVKSDVFNVLYVGKFDRTAGIETLIEAISKPKLHSLSNISLTLINNSPDNTLLNQKRVEKLVWDSGIENITTFVTGLSREELATYYAAADVCVVPSYYDPSGMVAIDAMASGTPVIASSLGGLKYVIEHQQTGLLFPARNSFSLTRAISRLITEPQMRSNMSVLARARVFELFNWDNIAEQLHELYSEQIGQQNLEILDRSLRYPVRSIVA